tara:strand:+ start:7286 stop:7531 length:246 start_codon:yes stop_codon:yes gene_type:complete
MKTLTDIKQETLNSYYDFDTRRGTSLFELDMDEQIRYIAKLEKQIELDNTDFIVKDQVINDLTTELALLDVQLEECMQKGT